MAEEKPIEKIVEEIFDDNLDITRKIMERIWFRNILYYIGEQYIEWVVSLNTFRRKVTDPFLPTPVSNIIRDYVRSMKAMILNKDFSIRVWPNSNEQADREASLLGENLLKWMDSENDEEFKDEKEKVSLWMILTGVGFMRTFPMLDRGEFGLDTNGNIIKSGEVVSENILPFNIVTDDLGDSLSKKRYVGIKSLKPKEWVEDTFKKIVNAEDNERIISYQQRLMKLVGEVSPWKGSGLESQMINMKMKDLVVFKEVEFQPTPKKPNGKYVVMVGDQRLLDSDSLPIPPENGKWDYTLTDFHYNYVPGRFWSDAGINDLISPQNIINSIDQDCEINRKGLGEPWVLVPGNINLKRLDKMGSRLKAIEYDGLTSGGQKPEINNGTPLPQQFLEQRIIQKEVAQDAAGDPKNILRGKSPTSKASGIMVDILRETAEQSHTPDIGRFYRSLKRTYRKRLILAKNLFTEKRIMKIAGKGKDIRIVAFRASDLRNNTDVRLELDSGLSSTKAGQTQMILNLIQSGMFGDLNVDPETRQELLRRLGLAGFRDKINVDVERAEEENMRIMTKKVDNIYVMAIDEEGQQQTYNEDPLFKYDNHSVHYETHRRFALSKEFKELPEQTRTITIAHIDCHAVEMQKEIQKQMEMMAIQEEMGKTGEVSVQGNQGNVPQSEFITA